MKLATIDTAAVARALGQIGDRPEDLVDGFFERLEEVELPPRGTPHGVRTRREEGLAVRLVREGRTWLASRDEISSAAFGEASRQVARAVPVAPYPDPAFEAEPWPAPVDPEILAAFPGAVERAVRRRHVAFPARLTMRSHRRWIQLVGPRLVPAAERESFYSLEADLPFGLYGTLLPDLGEASADAVASQLTDLFRSRQAPSPPAGRTAIVLAPAAAAVLLHEAVAHALEADILALSGRPEGAFGVSLGGAALNVLDSPESSPGHTDRQSDDEGMAVSRRWLLRQGVVDQPLADRLWAARSPTLMPGAGRRGSRHQPPRPRSYHLEVPAGEMATDALRASAEGGLWISQARRGRLFPLSGRFHLDIPCARRIVDGAPGDPVGPFRLRGSVAGLLGSIVGVGSEVESAGAGWCAKDGQRLPVWSTTPALRLEAVQVEV